MPIYHYMCIIGGKIMFTMFTSTKQEKVLRGQKKYYLSNNVNVRSTRPVARENGNVDSKADLSKCRKFSADLSDFG